LYFHKFNIHIFYLVIMMLFSCSLFAKPSAELELTEAQKLWLKDHPVIRLASDIAWPPFESVDKDGQYLGIAADYMGLVEQKLGIRFEVEKNKPWPEVVKAVKTRQLDVFSCVAETEERLEYVNFTRPYLSFPMVMVTTDNIHHIDGISGLENLTIGVVKSYATHEYLKANHPELTLNLVNSTEEGLKAVSQERMDVFIDNIASATTIIQTTGLTNLKISGEMPLRYELGMAVRKDWPEFIPILQRALDSISNEQRKEIHNKWIEVRYDYGFDYSLFWKSPALFAIIFGLLYFYIRKLSREITQRKQAQQAAIKALNEADKANQAKSEFLSVMSHELRTPLTSIKGAISMLSSGKIIDLPENAQEMLAIADRNSNRLILLINDILDIEKLLAGKMTFHKEKLIIRDLIDLAVADIQAYAKPFGVSFKVKMHECADVSVIADENRLMQVLSNFLSNAIKYSPQDASVLISAQCKDHKVRISVTDQGKGVPTDFHDRIFSHFSQADSSDTREKGGTGLGLAISKEIIERQGGSIGFTSEPGKGATFYFELEVTEAI